jgi:stress-induced morphogen
VNFDFSKFIIFHLRHLFCAPPLAVSPFTALNMMKGDPNMAMTTQDIETLIRAEFPNAQVSVIDTAGDGKHFAAEVIDESFRGKNRVQQQRAVYAALKGKMDGSHGELHALALSTRAPD